MLFRTTYTNKDYDKARLQVTGKAFSFWKQLQMGGVGSGRMMIAKVSEQLQPQQIQFDEINYGNIELRTKGIVVHMVNRQERYAWLIPYYRLVIYNTQYFSIHANGQVVHFEKNKNYKANKKFLQKMSDLKIDAMGLGYYDDF